MLGLPIENEDKMIHFIEPDTAAQIKTLQERLFLRANSFGEMALVVLGYAVGCEKLQRLAASPVAIHGTFTWYINCPQ